MDTLTMTNSEPLTIFDEIVNCGILEEDTIVNFGAGSKNGKFIETLVEYNGTIQEGTLIAIEPESKRIKSLTKKFSNENILFLESSLQSYIDSEPTSTDWVVITGVFDEHLYGENQYDYVESVVQNSMTICDKGVIFSIRRNIASDFTYSMLYFFVSFTNTYGKVTIKKVDDDNYVFCIFK